MRRTGGEVGREWHPLRKNQGGERNVAMNSVALTGKTKEKRGFSLTGKEIGACNSGEQTGKNFEAATTQRRVKPS